MSKNFRVFIIVAGALLLPSSPASAGDYGFCTLTFVPQTTSFVSKIRSWGGCGHDMNNPFWSKDPKTQLKWCLSMSSSETPQKRLDEMNAVRLKCEACNVYADRVTAAANDNIAYKCGYKQRDKFLVGDIGPGYLTNQGKEVKGDQRWLPDRAYHMRGCVKLGPSDFYRITDVIPREMDEEIAACKKDKGSVAASSLSTPKEPIVRDTIDRKKNPKRRNPDSFKSAKHGSNTSGNDLVNSSDKANRRASSKGSNTSAMDRLSGDSPLSSSGNRSSKTCEGGSRRAPAGGGASAVAKPDTPSMKADPTVDMGKCATCGKSPPTPPR
jgi:hypothetical protein